jgi:gamma-butyrobetaine dioxygenase
MQAGVAQLRRFGETAWMLSATSTISTTRSFQSVSLEALGVTMQWDTGTSSVFHYVWLRDNCGCDECRHVIAGERMSDPASIPLDLHAVSACIEGEELHLSWPDGHLTTFSSSWLDQHAYDSHSRATPRRLLRTWQSIDVSDDRPTADFEEIMVDDSALLSWLVQLARDGFTIVTNMGSEAGTVRRLAERIAFLRDSNFGLVWEVRSEPKPDSLAYTSIKLTAHTDLVSRESQPGVQFLHCLVNEATGGESLLVDGFAVAEELRRIAPNHWATLTRVPASFRYQNDFTDVSASFPVIRLDHRGEYFEVRYSNALLAPLDCDPDDVLPFYAAYKAFSELLREPRFEFGFRLAAGECEVFDNRRVMHGRYSFDPNSGPRHLQGCYIDTDDFHSKINVLQRKQDFRKR